MSIFVLHGYPVVEKIKDLDKMLIFLLRVYPSLNLLLQIFSDTKKQLQQEVEERLENTSLLTDADHQLTLKIESHDSEIKKITTLIESMASTIEGLKNANNILTNSLNDSALRFHVETISEAATWPFDTLITYQTKLTDTHNAMNTETGLFTAPFSGTYGFVFYGEFFCDSYSRSLYFDHNGARSKNFECYNDENVYISQSSSVYFALSLKQGDAVGIFTEFAYVKLDFHPAKFTGFLLQKY
jgi:hypothetical protein